MKSKIILISFLLMVMFAICFVIQTDEDPGIPLGSPIPEMSITTRYGEKVKINGEQGFLIIIFFHYKCQPCQYQLKLLEENYRMFSDIKLYLLTDDAEFFQAERHYTWQKLLLTENVVFAIVRRKEFKENFGKLLTPSIFIFNKDGILVSKIYGEVKLQRLLGELFNTVQFVKRIISLS